MRTGFSIGVIAGLIQATVGPAFADTLPTKPSLTENQAELDIGAINLHTKDEHYSPMPYRGWLPTLRGSVAVDRPHGRHAFSFQYADGHLSTRGLQQKARQQLAGLAYLFDRGVLRGSLGHRPARLTVGGGLRSIAWNTKFPSNAALSQPFESYLWSHSLVARAAGEWCPRDGSSITANVESAIVSQVARPAYSNPEPDFWGAAFSGKFRSPFTAPRVSLEVTGRIRLWGPIGARAGYQFHAQQVPDPSPVRTYGHLVFLGLGGGP